MRNIDKNYFKSIIYLSIKVISLLFRQKMIKKFQNYKTFLKLEVKQKVKKLMK